MLNPKSVEAESTRPPIGPADQLLNPSETFESVSAKIGGIAAPTMH